MKFSFKIELELSRSSTEQIKTRGNVLPNERMVDFRWKKIRAAIRKRDNEICQYCQFPAPDGVVDHIMPVSRGGSDDFDNLVWSCVSCNSSKGASTPQEWQERLIQKDQEPVVSMLPIGGEESPILVEDGDTSLSDAIRSERMREQVRTLVKSGMSKNKIIETVWGIKGGGRPYIRASQELSAIMATLV